MKASQPSIRSTDPQVRRMLGITNKMFKRVGLAAFARIFTLGFIAGADARIEMSKKKRSRKDMTITIPRTHSDLLQEYTRAKLFQICEVSGDIQEECASLKCIIENYAADHHCLLPDIDWSTYLPEEGS